MFVRMLVMLNVALVPDPLTMKVRGIQHYFLEKENVRIIAVPELRSAVRFLAGRHNVAAYAYEVDLVDGVRTTVKAFGTIVVRSVADQNRSLQALRESSWRVVPF
jgi:hypothetical protein